MPDAVATITKAEALKRLAEWMGWTQHDGPKWAYDMPCGRGRILGAAVIDSAGFNPFENLHQAFELQARLDRKQRYEYDHWLIEPVAMSSNPHDYYWACINATAEQRTREIVRVALECEVEA